MPVISALRRGCARRLLCLNLARLHCTFQGSLSYIMRPFGVHEIKQQMLVEFWRRENPYSHSVGGDVN